MHVLCMYVCIYACMYVCMHVCMYACMHALCMYVYMYVCMHVYTYVFFYIHPPHTFGSPVHVMHPSHLLLRTLIHHNSFRGNFWKSGYLKDKTWEVNIDMDLGAMICEVGGALSRSCSFLESVSGVGVEKPWDLQSIRMFMIGGSF